MLPTFLVLGAEKSGTTWLFDILARHPDIYLPDTKEPSFFNRRETNLKVSDYFKNLGLPWYEAFYANHQEEIAAGDVSPMYLCDDMAPGRIAATIPSARLVVILRDPVERAISHYWMAHNKRHVTQSLQEVVATRDESIVKRGLYGEQIERYLTCFPREQLLVLLFEEVMADRPRAIEAICEFIGVDQARLPADDLDKAIYPSTSYRSPWLHNASVSAATSLRTSSYLSWIPRLLKKAGFHRIVKQVNTMDFSKPPVPENLKDELRRFYAKDREKLETLLGRQIDVWPR